jgi:hypothetical protein
MLYLNQIHVGLLQHPAWNHALLRQNSLYLAFSKLVDFLTIFAEFGFCLGYGFVGFEDFLLGAARVSLAGEFCVEKSV